MQGCTIYIIYNVDFMTWISYYYTKNIGLQLHKMLYSLMKYIFSILSMCLLLLFTDQNES